MPPQQDQKVAPCMCVAFATVSYNAGYPLVLFHFLLFQLGGPVDGLYGSVEFPTFAGHFVHLLA